MLAAVWVVGTNLKKTSSNKKPQAHSRTGRSQNLDAQDVLDA